MSNLENNDKKIKELFHEDKFISKKADDLFNNFLKEESNMNKEHEPKVRKMSIWKRALATAACFVVLLGGANIYASTQGYGNVFFLIKYLVTGEKVEIVDKNALLSDRDIVISYEPIQLTENIRIQVRRLQIKDNKAVLSVVVKEDGEANDVVPLKYVVNNSKGDIICEQASKREMTTSDNEYCDELQLSSLYESDTNISLSIYNNASQQLVKLVIDINAKTITVEGAEEAISKISEKDLKQFIGLVSVYPFLEDDNESLLDDDMRIRVAFLFLDKYASNGAKKETINGKAGYKVETINKVLDELGYSTISKDLKEGNFKKVTYKESEYFVDDLDGEGEPYQPNTCLEITKLSYCAGMYNVEFKYTNIPEKDTFDVAIEDLDIIQESFMFKIKDENEFSKYNIIQYKNHESNDFDELEPYYESLIDDKTDDNMNSNTTTTNNTISVDNSTNTTTSVNTTTTNQVNTKIDNYASSMNWIEHWAPGLMVQYPDIMSKSVVTDGYRGSDVEKPDQVAVVFEGDLIGKDPDTQKKITSHTKITVYLPEYAESMSEIDYYAHSVDLVLNSTVDFSLIPGGPAGLTSKKGINWSEHSEQKDGKYYELYTSYQSDVKFGYKILFETDNIENYKVRNVINWFLGNAYYTSF